MNLFKKYFPVFLFTSSFLLIAKVIFNNGYPDFSNFYYGPLLALKNINPYLGNINLFTPTTYPPFIFWALYPLTLLPITIAEKLWTIGSIIALLISLSLLFKVLGGRFYSSEGLILSSLVFLSFPVKFTLGMGQINIFILLLVVLFLYFFKKQKLYSPVFLGLSLLLKAFPVFLISYFVITKKWKALFVLALTMTVLGLFTLLFISTEINLYFFQKILPTLIDSWKGDYYNQSLSGVLTRSFSDQNLRIILRGAFTYTLAGISFIAILLKRDKINPQIDLEIGIIITLTLLVNSFSWQHHFVFAIIPFFAVFFYLKKNKMNLAYYIILLLGYALIAGNLKEPTLFPVIMRSHVFFGCLILWALEIYLLIKINYAKHATNNMTKNQKIKSGTKL